MICHARDARSSAQVHDLKEAHALLHVRRELLEDRDKTVRLDEHARVGIMVPPNLLEVFDHVFKVVLVIVGVAWVRFHQLGKHSRMTAMKRFKSEVSHDDEDDEEWIGSHIALVVQRLHDGVQVLAREAAKKRVSIEYPNDSKLL